MSPISYAYELSQLELPQLEHSIIQAQVQQRILTLLGNGLLGWSRVEELGPSFSNPQGNWESHRVTKLMPPVGTIIHTPIIHNTIIH